MDPINPWIDPAEVRHLAEQLLRPVTPSRIEAADPGFDSSFVGFMPAVTPREDSKGLSKIAGAGASGELRETQAEPEAPAAATPPPERPPVPLTGPPQPPSSSRFLERIHIFRDWLEKNFSAREIFILDREGKVIFDESGHGRLHFMARNLALASRSAPHQNGNIHVKIGPASVLEVIPCETPYGRIVLGALVPESLPLPHVQTITAVLLQTASPA
jgi:hypothetical protein